MEREQQQRIQWAIGWQWLSGVGAVVAAGAFGATFWNVWLPAFLFWGGVIPFAVMGSLLCYRAYRGSRATFSGLNHPQRYGFALLLLSSFIVLTLNNPGTGWRRDLWSREWHYKQGEREMSSAYADDLAARTTRIFSWGAMVVWTVGGVYWQNLAIAEAKWSPPEQQRKKVRRRGVYNRT